MEIPLQVLMGQINDPKQRIIWDNRITKIEVLEDLSAHCYLENRTVNEDGYKGNFFNKNVWGIHKGVVSGISYADESHENESSQNNGQTIFEVITLKHDHGKTIVVLIQQLDPNSEAGRIFSKQRARKMVEWVKDYVKRIIVVFPASADILKHLK